MAWELSLAVKCFHSDVSVGDSGWTRGVNTYRMPTERDIEYIVIEWKDILNKQWI